MKLTTKLMGSIVAILALAIFLAVCSLVFITSLARSTDYAVNVAGKRRSVASEMYAGTLKMQSLDRAIMLRSIMQQAADENKRDHRDISANVLKLFAVYRGLVEDENARQTADRVRADVDQFIQAHEELIQDVDKQQFDQAQKVADQKVMPRAEAVTSELSQLVQSETVLLQTASDDAKSKATSGEWTVVVLTLVSMFAGAGVIVIVRRINSKLRDLARSMSRDAEQVTLSSNQVAASSQSLAQASSEQAASLEETSASGQELTDRTRKIVEHTNRASQSVLETDQQVKVANETLEKMVGSMREINVSSKKISKIIKVIDEIAFQTNILALNAAVEAARSGEAGMGFAVVADEVRNLAQRCAQAAQDTSGLIEESLQTANEGTERLNKVVLAIEGIAKQASTVKELVESVNTGSLEQSRSIDQISAAVAQMQTATQNTAASAEEGASASQEMNSHAESMRHAVDSLYEMVGDGDAHTGDSARRGLQKAGGRHNKPRTAITGPTTRGSGHRNSPDRSFDMARTPTADSEGELAVSESDFAAF